MASSRRKRSARRIIREGPTSRDDQCRADRSFKRRQVWRLMNAIDGRCLTFAVCRLRRPAVRLNQFGPLLVRRLSVYVCLSKRAYNMLLLPKYREPRSFSYPGIIHVPVTGRIDARSVRCPCLSYCVYETCERLALCGLCASPRFNPRCVGRISRDSITPLL